MFARFNLKTNRDFNENVNFRYSNQIEPIDYLVEYSADLEGWETLDIPGNLIESDYFLIGKKIYRDMKIQIHESLDAYIGVNGTINGSKLESDWFPNINADIFLSHSHKDEVLAIKLAGWLYHNFKLITFIDSCIWNYSDDLIREIDDKYCWNHKKSTYYYNKRNISTSHVHMMLMNALMKMIDKSESVFFLNTDNSIIKTEEEISKNLEKTYSPWIYSEINATNLIRKKPLVPESRNTASLLKSLNESNIYNFLINYSVDLSKMYEINDHVLYLWEEANMHSKSNDNRRSIQEIKGTRALDKLYQLTINK